MLRSASSSSALSSVYTTQGPQITLVEEFRRAAYLRYSLSEPFESIRYWHNTIKLLSIPIVILKIHFKEFANLSVRVHALRLCKIEAGTKYSYTLCPHCNELIAEA